MSVRGMMMASACKLKLIDARMSCCTSALEACEDIARRMRWWLRQCKPVLHCRLPPVSEGHWAQVGRLWPRAH